MGEDLGFEGFGLESRVRLLCSVLLERLLIRLLVVERKED